MNHQYYYLALQFSAIQKTVLRHDRLWSMAGMSQIMAWMNELAMPCIETGMSQRLSEFNEILSCEIAQRNNAKVLVAGGGKFIARFDKKLDAENARDEIIKLISTTLPMLEFQVSKIVEAKDLNDAKTVKKDKEKVIYPGIIKDLDEQKRCFRGYGVTFNPHLYVCPECGEYPSIRRPELTKKEKDEYEKTKDFCSICFSAFHKARINVDVLLSKDLDDKDNEKDKRLLTTLERIYRKYYQKFFKEGKYPDIPLNFEDLFPEEKKNEKEQRMAVWFSDLNNMNQKVPLWLAQPENDSNGEYSIPEIFSIVKDVNVNIVSEALIKTFNKVKGEDKYLPFRLIVAGGDDLRIVMTEDYILDFILNLSEIVEKKIKEIEDNHPLSTKWLKEKLDAWAKQNKKESQEIKPYSFGGAFVVTSLHTPFKKIHEACEEMMSVAKNKARKDGKDRMGNSINWAVLSVEGSQSDEAAMKFEKPLLIEEESDGEEGRGKRLSFRQFVAMRDFYKPIISGSHIQQIADKIIKYNNDSVKVEQWLKRAASAGLEKSYAFILVDPNFRKDRKKDGDFICERLSTLLELLSISRGGDE